MLPHRCPPLIAENVGKLNEFGNTIDLERVAAAVIDSSWHHSWHWKRDDTKAWRPVSLEGWRTALADGKSLLAGLETRAKRVREVLPLIEANIEKIERREADE